MPPAVVTIIWRQHDTPPLPLLVASALQQAGLAAVTLGYGAPAGPVTSRWQAHHRPHRRRIPLVRLQPAGAARGDRPPAVPDVDDHRGLRER